MFSVFCHQCAFWKQTNTTEGECTTSFPHNAFVGERIIIPDDLFGILVTPPDATCLFVEAKLVQPLIQKGEILS